MNGRKSGVSVFKWREKIYLTIYQYMAIYAGFYFDKHLYDLLTHQQKPC